MRATTQADGIVAPEWRALDRAFELAAGGPAHGPNPRVGCVVLDHGGLPVAEGRHEGAGTAHAEAAAVSAARRAGVDLTGSTAVVTLEPCAHTGRTGACAQLLADAGVRRVVYALSDPNPTASGGAAVLRAAGVDVVGDIDVARAEALLEVWLHAVRTGRPFITVKTAMTADGRVAAADGSSRWITSEPARGHAHRVRAEVDAIAIGSGTALADRPSLTARNPDGTLADHQPLRVVIGHRDAPLTPDGGEALALRTHDPAEVATELGAREVRHLLVEGGPTVVSAFLRAGLVDQVHLYLAPMLLGAGTAAITDIGVTTLADALRMSWRDVQALGPDVLLVGRPAPRRRS